MKHPMWIAEAVILEDDNLHKLAIVCGAEIEQSTSHEHPSRGYRKHKTNCRKLSEPPRCVVASLRSLLKTSFATMTSSRASWGRLLRCDPWKARDADATKMQIQTDTAENQQALVFEHKKACRLQGLSLDMFKTANS